MPRGNSTRSKEPQKKEINEKESKILERSVSKSAKPSKKVPTPAQQKDKSPAPARQTRSKSRTNISKSRISKSLVTKNLSSDSENEAESEVNDKKTVVFKKDSYVAFIDREAVLVGAEIFSIGRVSIRTSKQHLLIGKSFFRLSMMFQMRIKILMFFNFNKTRNKH